MKNILFLTVIMLFCFFNGISQNVGVGTTAPSEKLDVNGNINVEGTIKAGGTAGLPGQVLTTNNTGNLAWGYASQFPYFVSFRYNTTWVVPAGVTMLAIEAWGAGGGGNTHNGGGGGGYIIALVKVTPGTTLTIVTGTGGAGGSSSGNGSNSSVTFTGNQIVAYGGYSGEYAPNGGNYNMVFSDLNLIGYDGEYGECGTSANSSVLGIGQGGTYIINTILGSGGNGGHTTNTGGIGGIRSGLLGGGGTFLTGSAIKPSREPGGGGAVNGDNTSSTIYNTGANGKVVIHY